MKKIAAFFLACLMILSTAAFAETLTMATNVGFPPYEYYDDETGEATGIDVEIFKALCEKLGYDGEIVDMDFSSVITAVATGKNSMALAAITVTEDRLKSVDFSITYATGIQSVIVKEGSVITCVDDLFVEGAGYTIGVQEGTTGDIYASGDFEETGLATIERFKNVADAVLALSTGKIDAVIVDNGPAEASVAANEGLIVLDTAYSEEEYAIVLPKGSDMLDAVNTALQEMIDDGTIDAIIGKYITND